MNHFRNYIFPVVAGTIAGVIIIWGFDSFKSRAPDYFLPVILKVALLSLIITFLVKKRTKEKEK